LWAAAPRWALDSVRGPRLPPRGTGQPISLATNAATLSAVSTPAFAGDREGAVTLGGSAGDTGAGGGGVGALMGYFPAEVLLSADFASDFAAELSERLDVFGVIAAALASEGFAEVSVLDDAELDVPDGEDDRLLLSFGFAVVVSDGLDVFGLIAAAVLSEGFGVLLLSEGFGVLLLSEGFAEVSVLDFEVSTLDFAASELDFEVSELDELDALGALDVSGFGSSFADAADCGGSGVAPATGVPAPDAASGAVPAPVGAAVGWFVDVATPPAAGATESAPVDAEGPACSVPGPVA